MALLEPISNILANYGNWYLRGIGVTLLLAVVGTLVGLAIGMLVGMYRVIPIERQSNKVLVTLYKIGRFLTTCYIEFFRSTPMMVQAMFIYFGIAAGLFGVQLNVLTAGLLIITINTGAYMAEIVRSGIISVDKGQYEAAHSVGLSHWQTMKGIIMPQALRNILPTIGNEFIINMKDSCVLSIIGVTEIFYTSQTIGGAMFNVGPPFLIACVIYLVLTLVTTRILGLIERKMDGSDHYELMVDLDGSAYMSNLGQGGQTK
ncbi:amino acid ABC transporter permease [Peptococcus simiae]|uniref:Amino acid ABC transporter permease n=1 Tax=Peptococcus simiae TaxID=1643805 RepID=A0ABW9GZD2_9FIRM